MSTTQIEGEITRKAAGLGASLHGGRETFALRSHGESLTLYELLPEEQAKAHKRRWEENRRVSKTVKVVDIDFIEKSEWDWNGWKAVKIAKIDEVRIEAIRSLLKECFDRASLDYVDLLKPEARSVLLPESVGVRIALAFIAIKPIRRVDKQRACARQLREMSIEECYYWHSLCRSPSTPNGARALRTLLNGHLG